MCFGRTQKSKEYGKALFDDIEYAPEYTYKPFHPVKCTRTHSQHFKSVSVEWWPCVNCVRRHYGQRADDTCNCSI